jgi:glycerophosphoryl diester phosphodiesterase
VFFENTSQNIQYTNNGTNKLAIACHNCYQNDEVLTSLTEERITSAILNDVDLIELDVIFEKNEQIVVKHESDSNGQPLANILAIPSLVNATQLLFIEIKGEVTSKADIRLFLEKLMLPQLYNGVYSYLNAERFTILRSVENSGVLSIIKEVLNEDEFALIKPYIKLSRLHYNKKEKNIIAEINQAHQCGFHMVEFNLKMGTDVIKNLNSYAQSLGMAVNVFTLDESNYYEAVQVLKDEVDVLTVESEMGSNASYLGESIFQRIRELL